MNKSVFLYPVLILALLSGCEKEPDNQGMITGFWEQESIVENDTVRLMSECEQSTRLLIEQNGVYRLYSSCDAVRRSGTWLISGSTMLDLSMDRWNGTNKYEPYPVRFTILKLTDTELEIRIKTFIGDRKKLVLFTPLPQDNTGGLTPAELLQLDRINKTLRTYTYRFVRHE